MLPSFSELLDVFELFPLCLLRFVWFDWCVCFVSVNVFVFLFAWFVCFMFAALLFVLSFFWMFALSDCFVVP